MQAWVPTNYAILTKWVKVQHEKKTVSNLKSISKDFCSIRIISLKEKNYSGNLFSGYQW